MIFPNNRSFFGRMLYCDWCFLLSGLLYLLANMATISLVMLAGWWYVQAQRPVVEWVDPEGPGFRVVAVTPEFVSVRWINLRLAVPCAGRTEVAILGSGLTAPIEAYPFIIDELPQTFERHYRLPKGIPPGAYVLRILDIAFCNPLFENRQVLRVPFEVTP
ncbi:MAG TPA: hypothetical protein PK959_06695 [Candidatus Competibacteraceae bacterium]|nr:hypothetical protein [Candidatus Competibacteraceae bacterium]